MLRIFYHNLKKYLLYNSRVREKGTWKTTQGFFLQKNVKSKKCIPLLGNFLPDKWKLFMDNLKPQRLIPSSCMCDSVCSSWSYKNQINHTSLLNTDYDWIHAMLLLSFFLNQTKRHWNIYQRGIMKSSLQMPSCSLGRFWKGLHFEEWKKFMLRYSLLLPKTKHANVLASRYLRRPTGLFHFSTE